MLEGFITSTVVLTVVGVVAAFFREPLIAALAASAEKAIEARFNRQLEQLRSELQKSERQFEAQLAAKQAEIEAIRSGALSGVANRHSLLNQKRVEAVEKTWATVIELRKFLGLASLMSNIKFEETADATNADTKLREKFEQLFKPFVITDTDWRAKATLQATLCRPFLSEDAWKYFNAYSTILIHAYVQMTVIMTGVGSKMLKKPDSIVDDLKKVLPHFEKYLTQYGTSGFYLLLAPLEELTLNALRAMLDGRVSDRIAVEDADSIVKHAIALKALTPAAEPDSPLEKVPKQFRQE